MLNCCEKIKTVYGYRCIDDNMVIFNVPTRFGRNQFIVVQEHHQDDDVLESCINYVLYEKQKFCFRQFAAIHNKSTDLYDNLRIVPYVNDTVVGHRLDFLYFVTNFLHCFAVINNDFKYSDNRSYKSIKTMKIYKKIM
ncbi:hypothetical protein KM622_gp067 [Spodoptera exempta nucleopolyhedrovirus]|uniref:Uncharacterized protein n=1 Tax=Spodoptera exempta nucleopolyhedrovirus TaxID=1242863 RepID=A0A410S7T3_9ABAC|nr:hypothetical protein KM622_gp067 [Spodoptera exempta nucleopolyhedrovirus]QAT90353.1 hypothetical protein [Spodoptera exempta nucleopolyhedrovirus]